MGRLFAAIKQNNPKEVQRCIDEKEDVNQVDEEGYSAVCRAAIQDNSPLILLLLLAAKAKVDFMGTNKFSHHTPLYTAAYNNMTVSLQILIEAGAKIDHAVEGRFTPLYIAAEKGHRGIVYLLLAAGANINISNSGWKPIHTASEAGHTEIVKALIAYGASYREPTAYIPLTAPTPYSLAYRNDHKELSALYRDIEKYRGDYSEWKADVDKKISNEMSSAKSFISHYKKLFSTKDTSSNLSTIPDKSTVNNTSTTSTTHVENKKSTATTTVMKKITPKVKATNGFIGIEKQIEEIKRFFNEVKRDKNTSEHFLILSGPPGTGKTELVTKLSKECGFRCDEWKRGDANDKFIGQIETRVQEYFANAKKGEYVCLFIDEIDAICPDLQGVANAGSHNPDAVITLIQKEIDHLRGTNVVLVGATNYFNKIKSAIRNRAGIPVVFTLPSKTERLQLLENFLDNFEAELTLLEKIAEATAGWSPRLLQKYTDRVKAKARELAHPQQLINENFIEMFEPMREMLKQDYPDIQIEPPKLLLDTKDPYEEQVTSYTSVQAAMEGIRLFIANPTPYLEKVSDLKRHTILFGPPGTGKTSFARAIANSCHAVFIVIDGGTTNKMQLKTAFDLAKNFERAIIFIDEMDKIAHLHAPERELLQTEIDGFSKQAAKDRVLVVIGATNFLEHIAEPVLSRFNKVNTPLPTELQRYQIFLTHLQGLVKNSVSFSISLKNSLEDSCKQLAKKTPGFSPRDIKLAIDNAIATVTDKEQKQKVKIDLTNEHLNFALEQKAKEVKHKTISTTATVQATILSTDKNATTLVIQSKDLEKGDSLAEGRFGKVYRGTWLKRIPVAIKELNTFGTPAALHATFIHEAGIMTKLQHPHIVHFYGAVFESPYRLVMELMAKGSLFHVLRDKTKLTIPQKITISIHIGEGLYFLHHQQPVMLHRDLKSLNVLLDEQYSAKLADFGLTKFKQDITSSAMSESLPANTSTNKNAVGTLRWKAPELLTLKPLYSTASDIYAYGLVMWETAMEKLPYEEADNESLLINSVKSGLREETNDITPSSYKSLIERCWTQRREDRPAVEDVLSELNTIRETMTRPK